MIVLDTNVVSELMRPAPDPAVLRWVDTRPAGHLAITAITAAELLYGVGRLPSGKRRDELGTSVLDVLEYDFAERILPFGAGAVERYVEIVVQREAAGRPVAMADAQIAAICAEHGATLATRNTKDFDGTGLAVVDPWAEKDTSGTDRVLIGGAE